MKKLNEKIKEIKEQVTDSKYVIIRTNDDTALLRLIAYRLTEILAEIEISSAIRDIRNEP